MCLLFCFTACEEKNNSISGPELEWISGGTSITYTYSGGVISGYNFHRSFNVTKESGELTVNVQISGDDNSKVSGTFNVENGKQYSLGVKGTKSGSHVSSPGSKCLTVVFSSPNSQTDQEIKVDSYLVSSGGIDTYYCANSLVFGEISLSE